MSCFAFLPRCIGGKKRVGKGKAVASEEANPKDGPSPLSPVKNQDLIDVKLKVTDFFDDKELVVLGNLPSRVRVILDSSLPETLHGTSRVTDGIPLAVVNPRAPDRRYVILHELMHHQLDELGCPSLCCTVKGLEPPGSWLKHTKFQSFVRGLLVQLWELVQHSRFNMMLKRIFNCGPESARDGEYRRYIKNTALPMYGMCGQGGHASVRKVAVSAHVATCLLEASPDVQSEFKDFVRTKFAHGDEMVALGEKLFRHVRSEDVEFLKCSRNELDVIMIKMLEDLQKMLASLDTGMLVTVGSIKPLREKFNGRCSTVSEVDFCTANIPVSVVAGGFGGGSHFGQITSLQQANAKLMDMRASHHELGAGFGSAAETVWVAGCGCGGAGHTGCCFASRV